MSDADLRRDVGQLLWFGFLGTELPKDVQRDIGEGRAGAIVLFRRNLEFVRQVLTYADNAAGAPPDAGENRGLVEQAMAGDVVGERVPEAAVTAKIVDVGELIELVRRIHDSVRSGVEPVLVAVDQEGGRVQRIKSPATVWPPMLRFDDLNDTDALPLAREVGRAMGRELAVIGFDVDFAPVLDVHTNEANPIIGDRAFATTADRVASRALAFADGLKESGIIPCGKHFPGHGDTSTDSHLQLPRLDHDLERLESVELGPFARAAAAGLPMIMTAHVVFAAIDDDLPATLSPKVIDGVLRKKLGYNGVVVSDDLDMKAVSTHFDSATAAVMAVRAGCDALLLCCDRKAQRESYEALVRAGESDSSLRARIGESADRVRALKRQRVVERGNPADILGHPDHRELASRLASQ